jgi:hypothetical protein
MWGLVRMNTCFPVEHLIKLAYLGYATIDLRVSERPTAGFCYLLINGSKPVTGEEQAYVDIFTLRCENWEEEYEWPGSPIRYRFFVDITPRVLLNTATGFV